MQMPGEALLLKMWETLVEKGIGGLITSLLTPWHDKRLALSRIEIDKVCKIATFRAEQEIAQITNSEIKLIGHSDITPEENGSELSIKDIVLNNDMKRLIREEINVANAINYANERLIEDISDVPKEEMSQDWLNTWRDNASKVSDEEVQSLWGTVLAQEFLEPGRYSLRLLEFLRTISKADALLIERFAPFVVRRELIHGVKQDDETAFLEEFDFSVDELKFLEEMNIISGASTLGMIATLKNLKEEEGSFLAKINIDQNRVILLSDDNKDKTAQFNFFQVTKIGQEIFSLIDMNVSVRYVNWLAQQYTKDFKVEIYVSDNGNYKLESVFEKIE